MLKALFKGSYGGIFLTVFISLTPRPPLPSERGRKGEGWMNLMTSLPALQLVSGVRYLTDPRLRGDV